MSQVNVVELERCGHNVCAAGSTYRNGWSKAYYTLAMASEKTPSSQAIVFMLPTIPFTPTHHQQHSDAWTILRPIYILHQLFTREAFASTHWVLGANLKETPKAFCMTYKYCGGDNVSSCAKKAGRWDTRRWRRGRRTSSWPYSIYHISVIARKVYKSCCVLLRAASSAIEWQDGVVSNKIEETTMHWYSQCTSFKTVYTLLG